MLWTNALMRRFDDMAGVMRIAAEGETLETVQHFILERDKQDNSGAVTPLRQVDDAIAVGNSNIRVYPDFPRNLSINSVV